MSEQNKVAELAQLKQDALDALEKACKFAQEHNIPFSIELSEGMPFNYGPAEYIKRDGWYSEVNWIKDDIETNEECAVDDYGQELVDQIKNGTLPWKFNRWMSSSDLC